LLITSFIYSINLPQQLKFSVFYIPFICFLIFTFAFQKGFLSKVLSAKPLVFLGEISFSFYMIHKLVIRYLSLFFTNVLAIDIFTFFITIALSSVIYLYYEEPLRKFIRFGNKNNFQKQYKHLA
jgi:peptidoglycan/LPS O-acetylase OafA/YrhL